MFDKFDFVADRRLSRVEFVTMCADVLWNASESLIGHALENISVCRRARATRNNTYWRKVAEESDAWCRMIIPALYLFSLVVLFNVDMTDNYADPKKSGRPRQSHSAQIPACAFSAQCTTHATCCIACAAGRRRACSRAWGPPT